MQLRATAESRDQEGTEGARATCTFMGQEQAMIEVLQTNHIERQRAREIEREREKKKKKLQKREREG